MKRQIIFLVLILAITDTNAGYMLHVCKEEPVKLFADTAINPTEEFSVTMNHNGTSVGLWTNNEPKCFHKICRYENSDIWMNDFSESDNGLYALLYQRHMHGPTEKQKERIFLVTIPPLPSCKPRFAYVPADRVSGSLIALLPEIGCGIPPVTLFWFSGPNQKYNKEEFANLSQDSLIHLRVNSLENPGVYIACIEGPALRCVKNKSYTDFCYEFHIPESKGDGTQLSAVQFIERIIWTHWIVTIIILTFITVTIQWVFSLIVHHEQIQNIIQNIWRRWRHGNARNVGDIGIPNDNMVMGYMQSVTVHDTQPDRQSIETSIFCAQTVQDTVETILNIIVSKNIFVLDRICSVNPAG